MENIPMPDTTLADLDKLEMMCDIAIDNTLEYQEIREEIDRIRNGIIMLQLDNLTNASYNDAHKSLV
jgi:hypothetical protein